MKNAWLVPPVKDKFGALVVDPFVVPNTNVAVAILLRRKTPVPDKVKLVASAMSKTVVPFVALVSVMFEAKLIARVLALLELKIPVLKPLLVVRVPAVKVNVFVTTKAALAVTVAPGALTVTLPTVLVLTELRAPVAKNVGLKLAALPPIGATNISP